MISLFNYLDKKKEDLKYNNPDSLFGYAWGMTKEAINLQSDTASDILNAGLDGAVSLFNIDTKTTPARPAITTEKTDLNPMERYYLGLLNVKQTAEDIVSNLPSSGVNVARGGIELGTSPFDAITGIAQTAEGGLLKAMPDSWEDTTIKIGKAFGHDFEASIEKFNDFKEWGVGRYGTPEDFRRTVLQDPLGFMVDAWMTGGLAKLGLRTAKNKMPEFTPEMQGKMIEAIQKMDLAPIKKSTLPFDPLNPIKSALEVPKFSMFMGDLTPGVGFDEDAFGPIEDARSKAETMLESGGRTLSNISEIWDETGHFVTPSGNIVWEIDDSPMQFKLLDDVNALAKTSKQGEIIGVYRGEDFLDHPELFANYEEFKDMEIIVRNGEYNKESGLTGLIGSVNQQTGAGQYGEYQPSTNTMLIYVDPQVGLTVKHKEVIVHEIQHGAQDIEGQMGGGNQSMLMMQQLSRSLKAEHKMLAFGLQAPSGMIFKTAKQQADATARVKKISGWIGELNDILTQDLTTMTPKDLDNQKAAMHDIYFRLEGEWMARNTQTRMEYMQGLAHKQGVISPLDELGQPEASEQGYRLDEWDRRNLFPLWTGDDKALDGTKRIATDTDNIWNDDLIIHTATKSSLEKMSGLPVIRRPMPSSMSLLGDAIPRLKPSDFKRNNDGTYVGFNKSINTPHGITKLLKQLEGLATEGADARFWYEDSSKEIMNLVNGDVVEAEKIAQILAITSQEATVKTNVGFAFKALAQHKAGMPVEGMRFGKSQNDRIMAVLNGESWEGRKTNSFYQNLMVQIDPSKVSGEQTTQDIWMARAFGLASGRPGDAQYQIMEEITQNIATQNGWTAPQAQAAIWVATKARNESMRSEINKHIKAKGWGVSADNIKPEHQAKFDKYFQKMVYESEFNLDEFTDAAYSFADGIADNLGFVSLEAVPSTELTNVLPGIHNAPPEQVAEFTKSMYSIFLDENGVDLLAKEIGMASPDNFMGFGGWEGDINPNVQVQGLLSGTIKGGINPADVQLVELYASVVGTVFKQKGVGYRRAFEETTIKRQNGVDVDAGRRLTKDEHQKIYDALQKQFGNDWIQPTSTGTGVDIVLYPNDDGGFDIPNAKFKQMVKKAIMVADIVDVDLVYYRSEGALIENNWKENPNGESYQIRENRTEKSQNLYEQLVYKYSQEADTIRQQFEEKYGWGEVKSEAAALSIKGGLLKQTKQKLPNHLLE